MSKGDSGLFHIGNKFADKDKRPSTLEEDKQGKHIGGHKTFSNGKSVLTVSMKEAAYLVRKYSGTGEEVSDAVTNNRERVDFGHVIGYYVDRDGKGYPTTIGIIHHSKYGAHIVPAVPKGGF